MMERGQNIGVLTIDNELRIRSWDRWLESATGLSESEVRGQLLQELFPHVRDKGIVDRLLNVIRMGQVEILVPSFHKYLIPCPPQKPSRHFTHMRQRVIAAPITEGDTVVGALITVEDVTSRMEKERELEEKFRDERDVHGEKKADTATAYGEILEGGPLSELLDIDDWRLRRQSVESLARRGDPSAVGSLVSLLRREHRNISVVNSALQVLTMMDCDAVSALGQLLQDTTVDLRIYAALALGETGDKAAVPFLLEALDDPDQNVRYHAVEALGKIRAEAAVERLCALVATRDFFLAFPALEALKHIGDPRAVETLKDAVHDPLLGEAAVEALGFFPDAATADLLAELLNDPDVPATATARALLTCARRLTELYGDDTAVVERVLEKSTPEGSRRLVQALQKAAPEEQPVLLKVLGWMEQGGLSRVLLPFLSDPTLRRFVLEVMVRQGADSVPALLESLSSNDMDVVRDVVSTLGRIGDARAVPALISLLQSERGLSVVVAGALSKIGDLRAFEPLLQCLSHEEAAIRQAAVAALHSLGHPDLEQRVRDLLIASNPRVRESACRIAGYFGYPSCVERLFRCCRDPQEAVRIAALEHVGYVEDPRVPLVLEAALQDPSPLARTAAARSLSYVDSRDAERLTPSFLEDPDPWVRYYAVKAAEIQRCASLYEKVRRLLHEDSTPFVRVMAAEALGTLGGVRAVPDLTQVAACGDRDMVRGAIAGLGAVGHPEALPPIFAALRASDPMIRRQAAESAAVIGGAQVAVRLQWLAAADRDRSVASYAMELLGRMGTQESVSALVELTMDLRCREEAMRVLTTLRPEHVPFLESGLNHAHPRIRASLVTVLARMKHPAATRSLLRALEDPDDSVRLHAVQALTHLNYRAALPMLQHMAQKDPSPSVRHLAARLVGRS